MLQHWLAYFTPMILSASAAGPSPNKIQVIRCPPEPPSPLFLLGISLWVFAAKPYMERLEMAQQQ